MPRRVISIVVLLPFEMMHNLTQKLTAAFALFFLMCSCSTVQAQNARWRKIKDKSLSVFDWNCASPTAFPKSKLKRVVEIALKNTSGGKTWADRAFVFDINADQKLEYFVPLVCGATGNCTWGVFTLKPARFIGIIDGQYIYIHQRKALYPDIITYSHMSAAEGILVTYGFRRNRYSWLGDEYPTDHRGGDYGNKIPPFLEKASSGCDALGN